MAQPPPEQPRGSHEGTLGCPRMVAGLSERGCASPVTAPSWWHLTLHGEGRMVAAGARWSLQRGQAGTLWVLTGSVTMKELCSRPHCAHLLL